MIATKKIECAHVTVVRYSYFEKGCPKKCADQYAVPGTVDVESSTVAFLKR